MKQTKVEPAQNLFDLPDSWLSFSTSRSSSSSSVNFAGKCPTIPHHTIQEQQVDKIMSTATLTSRGGVCSLNTDQIWFVPDGLSIFNQMFANLIAGCQISTAALVCRGFRPARVLFLPQENKTEEGIGSRWESTVVWIERKKLMENAFKVLSHIFYLAPSYGRTSPRDATKMSWRMIKLV